MDVIANCKEVLIIGDWNVRLQARREDEQHIIGPYVYGRGSEFMEHCERRQIIASNRELMINTMNTHELVITNTWFQKAKEQKVTYREIGTARDNKNFEPTEFADIDNCVVKKKWRNNIIDVSADTNTYFPSPHYPQIIKHRRKLKMTEEKPRPIKWKGVQYDVKEKSEEYNTIFQLLFWDNKEEINNQNEQLPITDHNENIASNEETKKEENHMTNVE